MLSPITQALVSQRKRSGGLRYFVSPVLVPPCRSLLRFSFIRRAVVRRSLMNSLPEPEQAEPSPQSVKEHQKTKVGAEENGIVNSEKVL